MAVPAYDHIVVVMMENHDYSEIIGNPLAPYINSLAAGGALLSNYSGVAHPSEPNYFALYAGSTFGLSADISVKEPDPSLATILQGAGKTFAGYVEHPNTSFDHNPWEFFPEGLSVERDFSTFPSADFSSLPTVSFVIPNTINDMHDGDPASAVAQGDTWLQGNLSAYARWAQANNSLLVLAWDESDTSPNHVAAVLYGAHVVPGTYATAYNHYNMLSTILSAYGLTGPNNAATAAPIDSGIFQPAICFAAGTLIQTERGEVPVEQLKIGDKVRTASGHAESVVWIGSGRVLVTPGRRSAATPVIVRKGALGPNVPHCDLRVTKGHSLYLDEVLIPVEFLVNYRSIVWDDSPREIEIYHIELPKHGVLLANGAPAESYRDDGNRWLYQNAMEDLELQRQQPCVPLVTGGPVVDRVWQRLLEQAPARAPLLTTEDADLHLLVDGERVDCRRSSEGRYVFQVPARPHSIRIVSRSAVPAELGLARDTRNLGVALKRIALWQGWRLRLVEASDPILLDGFHAFEPGIGLRWTDGNAPIPASLFSGLEKPTELELHVGCTSHYQLPAKGRQKKAA